MTPDEVNTLEDPALTPDIRPATIRTAVPAMWTTFILWLVARFTDWTISDDDSLVLVPILGVALGIVYRVGRELEARWPIVGRVLFGSSRTPTYGS